MPLNSNYDTQLKEYFAKVEAGVLVEEGESPFVCDGCGGYFHGGDLSSKSTGEQLLCTGCSAHPVTK